MANIHRVNLLAALLLLAGGLLVRPAGAQMDLSGGWAQKTHEDALERGAGPEIAIIRVSRLTMRRVAGPTPGTPRSGR